ncbi:MAG TPA: zinc ribbon domain-containing protein [Caldisericia bacterium]|nr:zinc ribbon domain-containing protein [Caldisericia bacterium]HXK52113.1 zinc ribbon domain-containing protein [Caldisericia bacterium]
MKKKLGQSFPMCYNMQETKKENIQRGQNMPIYEFKCEDCGENFDVFSTYDELAKVTCPKCQSKNLKKLISHLGFIKHPDQSCCSSSSSSESSSSCSSCSGGSCSTCK